MVFTQIIIGETKGMSLEPITKKKGGYVFRTRRDENDY